MIPYLLGRVSSRGEGAEDASDGFPPVFGMDAIAIQTQVSNRHTLRLLDGLDKRISLLIIIDNQQ